MILWGFDRGALPVSTFLFEVCVWTFALLVVMPVCRRPYKS